MLRPRRERAGRINDAGGVIAPARQPRPGRTRLDWWPPPGGARVGHHPVACAPRLVDQPGTSTWATPQACPRDREPHHVRPVRPVGHIVGLGAKPPVGFPGSACEAPPAPDRESPLHRARARAQDRRSHVVVGAVQGGGLRCAVGASCLWHLMGLGADSPCRAWSQRVVTLPREERATLRHPLHAAGA
jgi:hypothetical protein